MTRLSHSASERYKLCPASYKLHYLDKIRPNTLGSALLFGGALDDALNVLLETKLDIVPESATDDLDRLKSGFDNKMTYQMVGKEYEDIRTTHFIEYYGSDFDEDILTQVEVDSLEMFISNAGYVLEEDEDYLTLYNDIKATIKEGLPVDSTDQSYFNYCSWLSLKRKGHLMLEHYKNEIMPKIKRVVSIQRKVNLPNESGDTMIGYIDFEAELVDYPEMGVITIDNKTSSKKYKESDINDKGQLLVYDEYTENGYGAYIVLLKKIKYITELKCKSCGEESTRRLKNCPQKKCSGKMEQVAKIPTIDHQILVDGIDEEKKDLHFDELCGILEGIEEQDFAQNREACFQFGRKCAYYDYCRSNPANPDTKGLIKK